MYKVREDQTDIIEVEPGLFGVKLIDGQQGTRNLALLRGWPEPGASHSPHTHDAEEVVTFLSGHGTVCINGKEFTVQKGDSVWIPPLVTHSTINTGDDLLSFVAAFSDSYVSSSSINSQRVLILSRLWSRCLWFLKHTVKRFQ
jgi:quercetin dioxygenase-like cupin family protein